MLCSSTRIAEDYQTATVLQSSADDGEDDQEATIDSNDKQEDTDSNYSRERTVAVNGLNNKHSVEEPSFGFVQPEASCRP